MATNIVNQVAFLRTTREFPTEVSPLVVEINKAYIDTANAINNRIIGIFPLNRAAITGESWFLVGNRKQQTLRQVYSFTSTTSFMHGIKISNPNQFTRNWGTYTDGTNSYGLLFGSSVAIPGQISFYITSTQVVFVVDGSAPSLSSGRIILEWLSEP